MPYKGLWGTDTTTHVCLYTLSRVFHCLQGVKECKIVYDTQALYRGIGDLFQLLEADEHELVAGYRHGCSRAPSDG